MSAVADDHPIVLRDDSDPRAEDASMVAVCKCGRSFVGFGGDRGAMVDWEHRQHQRDTSIASSAQADANHITMPEQPRPRATRWDSELASDFRAFIREHGALPLDDARRVVAEEFLTSDIQFNRVIRQLRGQGYRTHRGWMIAPGGTFPAYDAPLVRFPDVHPRDQVVIDGYAQGLSAVALAAILGTTATVITGMISALRSRGLVPSEDAAEQTPRPPRKPGRKKNGQTLAIYQRLRDGRDRHEIAAEFGVTVSVVNNVAARHDLSTPRGANINPADVYRLADQGLTAPEIAERMGIARSAAYRHLRNRRAA